MAAFVAAPLLGAVEGGAVEGLQGLAGHAGHRFADEQGAWACRWTSSPTTYGFDPHVGLLRGWTLALPAAAAWWLFVLPASRAPAAASPPAGAVPQAG